ncbi:MAG: hypothetical protein ACJASV_000206 [Pseudorhodobacter sp.]|jgi:hypothetical protein
MNESKAKKDQSYPPYRWSFIHLIKSFQLCFRLVLARATVCGESYYSANQLI